MVVYCKTQKELDHVSEILGYVWTVSTFKKYPCINTNKLNSSKSLNYYQELGTDLIVSYEEFLKLKNINIMKYKEGDILIDKYRCKVEVLGVCGKVYFISVYDDFEMTNGIYTQKELDDKDFRLFTEEPIKEVTLADISKAMNIPLDKLRIKE